LVKAAPILSAPADNYAASGSTVTYTYTVKANANGGDTYPVSAAVTTPPGTTNATGVTITPSVTSLNLGASVITAVPTASTIQIPFGTDTYTAVNDIVVVGGVDYIVSAITAGNVASHTNTSATDGAAGTTTAETPTTITLAANPAGSNTVPALTVDVVGTPSPLVGQLVVEQQTFTVAVTATAGPATGNATVPVTTSVGTTGAVATDATVSTFNGANLTITKEVSTDGGTTFAASGTGAPGSTLTYRITISNTGAGNATSVIVTDPMPLYTTYTAGTAKSDTTAGVTYAAAATALTDASDAPTDTYDFGITAANQATLNIGTLAGGSTSVLYYQVTIN